MPDDSPTQTICGLWIDDAGLAHLALAQAGGTRVEQTAAFRPFAWLAAATSDFNLSALQPENRDCPGNAGILPAKPGFQIQPFSLSPLSGAGVFTQLAHADSPENYDALLAAAKTAGAASDAIRPFENQFLLQTRQRLFGEIGFHQLRRCQLDIETASANEGVFSDAANPDDRILAIGLQFTSVPNSTFSPSALQSFSPSPSAPRRHLLVLDEMSDAAEKKLLKHFNDLLASEDPDTIEGHNIFKFDLDYLRQRAKRLKVPCAWGRFGQKASFRNSRLKVAERWLDFPRCDLPGRAVIDTYLLVQLHDITTRELTSYGLKESAVFFGITPEDAAADSGRTYIEGAKIHAAWRDDRAAFLAYLADDLRETKGLADLLLPTYFEQTRSFPILLQDAALRGTTTKIDLLFLEEYYHARQSCPAPVEVPAFAGGYTRSFKEGVFKNVLHFDVASLYPSLLLSMDRNPAGDTLGVFIPMLRRLREYRMKYKQLARSTTDELLRAEYQARQASFKILINSFYGYLGFSGARFGDGALAAEVTRRGRELLQALIDKLAAEGGDILEADTDGIYLSSEKYFANPAELLARAQAVLPEGIDLEHDGSYAAMFCYKSKNYALLEHVARAAEPAPHGDYNASGSREVAAGRESNGQARRAAPQRAKITIRGSALRSRGTEPYLKKLTDTLIRYLLLGASGESRGRAVSPKPPAQTDGALGEHAPPTPSRTSPESPATLIEDYRKRLAESAMPVAELAKSETLSQNPDAYEQFIAQGGKPRRASAEAALQMSPRPRMGERVSYYITAKAKGRTSDWQRARPAELFDAAQAETAYDPQYYLDKIDDWLERYGQFLGDEAKQCAAKAAGAQGELF